MGSEREVQARDLFACPLQVFGVDPRDCQNLGAGKGLAVVLEALQVVQVGAVVVGDLQVSDLLDPCLLLEDERCGGFVGHDLSPGHGADLPGAAHLIEKGFGGGGHVR